MNSIKPTLDSHISVRRLCTWNYVKLIWIFRKVKFHTRFQPRKYYSSRTTDARARETMRPYLTSSVTSKEPFSEPAHLSYDASNAQKEFVACESFKAKKRNERLVLISRQKLQQACNLRRTRAFGYGFTPLFEYVENFSFLFRFFSLFFSFLPFF